MSLIREILALPDRVEAAVRAISVAPPSDPALPMRVKMALVTGEEIEAEVFSLYIEDALARVFLTAGHSQGGGACSPYTGEVVIHFPNSALAILDWGVLKILRHP